MKLAQLKEIMLEQSQAYFDNIKNGLAGKDDRMQNSPEEQVQYRFENLDLKDLIRSASEFKIRTVDIKPITNNQQYEDYNDVIILLLEDNNRTKEEDDKLGELLKVKDQWEAKNAQ